MCLITCLFQTDRMSLETLAIRPGTGFGHPEQINDLVYAFDAELFGVESYRHWTRQPDPLNFLRRVLAGEVISDLPP